MEKFREKESIYDAGFMEELLDEDELTPQEEAFMRGYIDENEDEENLEVEEVED